MLDPDVRRELRSLTRETADLVARHLVMTGRLLDDDPEQAVAHGRAARAMAGRIGVVREAAGLAAYAAGEWTEALADLRAARRITGQAGHLAVLADCERALGRPERALALADDPDVPSSTSTSGSSSSSCCPAPAATSASSTPPSCRCRTLHAGRPRHGPGPPGSGTPTPTHCSRPGAPTRPGPGSRKTAGVDVDEGTDAGDRLLELDGVVLQDPRRRRARAGGPARRGPGGVRRRGVPRGTALRSRTLWRRSRSRRPR
jgi:hypothetical protein